jgi:hypothetical protein
MSLRTHDPRQSGFAAIGSFLDEDATVLNGTA